MADQVPNSTTSPSPASQSSQPASTLLLRAPLPSPPPPTWSDPDLSWLERTWTVTHSTLPMWRKARNVRITYKILEGGQLDDTVESEATEKTWLPQPKAIHGIDTPDGKGGWNWRGKGWLKIASSHWQVLGHGTSSTGENWVVTWFSASMFTPAGADIYCDRKEGISEGLYKEIMDALVGLAGVGEGETVARVCKEEMREVKIVL